MISRQSEFGSYGCAACPAEAAAAFGVDFTGCGGLEVGDEGRGVGYGVVEVGC